MPDQMPPLGFDDQDVVAAYGEYDVQTPYLGRGSYKVAYLVRAGTSERVLKILTDPLDTEIDDDGLQLDALPERVARELIGMSQVDSQHVVKIIAPPSSRTINGRDYIYYQEPFYGGGTLRDRLATGPLSGDATEDLVRSLVKAVRDLWNQAGIVHRDIKPGNIVFDEIGRPILLDLGIALYTALSGLTESFAQSPRTNIYAAPEQFEMRRYATIDFRTDLFQVGIVGFEALTGRHPFLQPGVSDLDSYLLRLFADEPIDVTDLPCSDGLKRVIRRLLSHRPNRRYRTIDDALEALGGKI